MDDSYGNVAADHVKIESYEDDDAYFSNSILVPQLTEQGSVEYTTKKRFGKRLPESHPDLIIEGVTSLPNAYEVGAGQYASSESEKGEMTEAEEEIAATALVKAAAQPPRGRRSFPRRQTIGRRVSAKRRGRSPPVEMPSRTSASARWRMQPPPTTRTAARCRHPPVTSPVPGTNPGEALGSSRDRALKTHNSRSPVVSQDAA
ncbi:uncharacterized protein LOC142929570 [Petromyzon marinus]|uniref:uncharacterized protein LOC142929570 n=1 Tax=Petromyzon marinus TaxID=7757 RepID=UPI003F71DC4A